MAPVAGHTELARLLVEAIVGPGKAVRRLVLEIDVHKPITAHVEYFPDAVELLEAVGVLECSDIKPIIVERGGGR